MTNDLLRREECVVADVVDRDADADRSPACAIETEFAGSAPGFGFESLGRFAKQCLFWRIDDPGASAVECDDEVLVLAAAGDWSTDALSGMIASGDADGRAGGVNDRCDFAFTVEFEQVTIGRAGSHSATGRDATGGNLDHVDWIGGAADANDRPLFAGGVVVFPPEDLGRSVWLGLQRIAAGLGHVGESVPGLSDVDLGGDDAVKDDSADLVFSDRFDGDAETAGVFVFSGSRCFNRGIADEAGQVNGASFRVGDRRIETDEATDRDERCGFVVNANGRCVSQMRSWSRAAGESIAVRCFGRCQQPVVFDRGDVETVAGSNTSGHLRNT